jgi:hypothetical protein
MCNSVAENPPNLLPHAHSDLQIYIPRTTVLATEITKKSPSTINTNHTNTSPRNCSTTHVATTTSHHNSCTPAQIDPKFTPTMNNKNPSSYSTTTKISPRHPPNNTKSCISDQTMKTKTGQKHRESINYTIHTTTFHDAKNNHIGNTKTDNTPTHPHTHKKK